MTKFILIFTTVIKRLPGDFEYPNANEEKELLCRRSRPNFILLVFVGGVTYAEVAAIRYLNKSNKGKFKHKDSVDYKFIILTTHIINGKKFIDNLKINFDNTLSNKEFFTQLKQMGL